MSSSMPQTTASNEGISFSYVETMLGRQKAEDLFGGARQFGSGADVVRFTDLWLVANRHIHATGDEGHQLTPVAMPVGSFELLAMSLRQADTMNEGLDRIAKASRVLGAALKIAIRRGGGKCSIVVTCDPIDEPKRSLYLGLWVVVLHCLLRWLVQRALRPAGIALPSTASPHTIEVLRLLQCPITTSAPQLALTYRARDCAGAFAQGDIRSWEAEVYSTYCTIVDEYAAVVNNPPGRLLADRVRQSLRDGHTLQSDICTRLNCSPASLRRKLAREGFTFRQLLDEHRRQHFERLTAGETTMEQVAASIGYSDGRSLRRARRRWR